MAGQISLKDVPDDFSQSFLNYKPTLRQKQRAVAFVKDAYIKSVNIFRGENENSIQMTAKIFRSQRKSEDPHRVNLDVNITGKSFYNAHCNCKAGVSGQCARLNCSQCTGAVEDLSVQRDTSRTFINQFATAVGQTSWGENKS
uniref:Uncharacterized protein n=1 Tax=Magallana gigas TaxID=29159 RepID=A0A8W8NYL0_MAGGI